MSVMGTGPNITNLFYLLIGAVVMIVGGLGYYAYEQSRAAADVETQLEMPKLTGN